MYNVRNSRFLCTCPLLSIPQRNASVFYFIEWLNVLIDLQCLYMYVPVRILLCKLIITHCYSDVVFTIGVSDQYELNEKEMHLVPRANSHFYSECP